MDSCKGSCDGRYYLFSQWLNPIRVPRPIADHRPVVVFYTVSSHPEPTPARSFAPLLAGHWPQITSLAVVQNSPRSDGLSPLFRLKERNVCAWKQPRRGTLCSAKVSLEFTAGRLHFSRFGCVSGIFWGSQEIVDTRGKEDRGLE